MDLMIMITFYLIENTPKIKPEDDLSYFEL